MRKIFFLALCLIVTSSYAFGQGPAPAKVVVSKITRETVSQGQSFIGTLYYERVSHVSSEVAGLVNRIDVMAGDRVKEKERIVSLDTQMLEKEIQIQKNIIDQADLNISHLKKNYERMDMLFKRGSTSEKDHDDAGFAYQTALLEKASAQTMLEKLLIRQDKSTIYAPFDGVILEKYVDTGDWVQQGKSLVRIGSSSDLFVRVPVAETLLKFVTPGQTVDVTLNAYNRQVKGTIENMSPTADEKTKNIFLKIRIPKMTDVAQNMSATVSVPTGKSQSLFMIPRDALVQLQGRDMIFTIKDEKAVPLPIHIVSFLEDRVGVDNDQFSEGMTVVVEGNERLRPGQPVIVIREQ